MAENKVQFGLSNTRVAFLDASDLGFGVYRGLGFEPTSMWEVWVKTP
jgi:hypothetical protein